MEKIYKLWQRQLKKYFRSKSRIVGSMAQPILFLVALGYGFGSVFQKAGSGNYIEFLAPGIIGMSIIFTAVFSGIEIIWDRQFGFLKEMMVAPISRLNIMIGRTLGGATVATIQGLMVLAISLLFGFHLMNPVNVLIAIFVMFLIATLFTSLGTMVASLLEDMQGFQLIMNFLIMPLFFLSGSLFPLQGLPPALSLVADLDPLTYGIDALRFLFIGQSHYSLVMDIGMLFGFTALFVVLGTYFFKRVEV